MLVCVCAARCISYLFAMRHASCFPHLEGVVLTAGVRFVSCTGLRHALGVSPF